MKQGIRNKKSVVVPVKKEEKPTPKVGTSKLEGIFAREFLEKLGIEYVYQYEAKDIKRYFDFYLPNSRILLEIDGDYYHANPIKFKKKNAMQKKNNKVDELKNQWAAEHSIPLIRIWENDIRNNPKKVFQLLTEKLYIKKR